MKSHLTKLLIAVAISLFAMFVWPTRYRYDHMHMNGYDYLTRTNRLTDKTEYQISGEWVDHIIIYDQR